MAWALTFHRLGNGLVAANDWGNESRLASRRLYRTTGGTNLSWLGYGYDSNDNITSITDLIDDTRSVYYGYDVNGRLKSALQTNSGGPAAGNGTWVRRYGPVCWLPQAAKLQGCSGNAERCSPFQFLQDRRWLRVWYAQTASDQSL